MPITIVLPGESEQQLTTEAIRVGVTPEALAADMLVSQLAARRAALVALLDAWIAEEPKPDVDGHDLLAGIDANRARSGERPLFPPEMKGKTW